MEMEKIDRVDFVCRLLSDVVIHSSSNKEGKVSIHDYIPGSNFLGIVAKNYDDFGNEAFDIFHSGKVMFGDANLLLDDEVALRPPLCWFGRKGESITTEDNDGRNLIYNQLHLDDEDYKELVSQNIQLKQIRGGYFFNKSRIYETISTRYSQKSAHDSKKRRSKEGMMFGYYSLPKGLELGFNVSFRGVSDENIQKVIEALEGVKRVGKSRSAEYGAVEITKLTEQNRLNRVGSRKESNSSRNLYIYASSRLALIDEDGQTILKPTIKSLNLPETASIDWGKSQIRTSQFTPYNFARRTRDYQRLIIEKGSVIVIKNLPENFDAKEWLDSLGGKLGVFLSEGFGEIIVNPSFLDEKNPKLKKNTTSKTSKIKKIANNSTLNSNLSTWLKNRKSKQEVSLRVSEIVKEFIEKNQKLYIDISPSQWGVIRSFANKENLEEKIKNYISRGTTSKEQWSEDAKNSLMSELNSLKREERDIFILFLAQEITKEIKRRS